MNAGSIDVPEFTFVFGQRVRIRAPHPDAGATGDVMNAYLYPDGRKEKVFVAIPGGDADCAAEELEAVNEGRAR